MINTCSILLAGCLMVPSHAVAQQPIQPLSLAECHELATENYPMLKQHNLIARSAAYSIEQANAAYLPQISINGQATYQSAVTQLPIRVPGADIPMLDKDQYKVYGEANQTIFDGGTIRLQKQAIDADAGVEHHALEVELYKIRERVNQLFFGILLLDAQLGQNRLLKDDIEAGLMKSRAAIAHGTALKSSGSVLEAELLKADQRTVELEATRTSYLRMLGAFINRNLDAHTVLAAPGIPEISGTINRPELGWYAQQLASIAVARELLTAKNLPRLGAFLQGGVGRPALNMLSNDFDAYYYGGIRLSIPLSGFYTLKKEKAVLDIRQQAIAVQQETFLFNTDLAFRQQHAEAAKYGKLLETDDGIISLRASVKDAALAQLENGTINTADYLREVHAEDNAKLAKAFHEIQLLKAQYDIQYILGDRRLSMTSNPATEPK